MAARRPQRSLALACALAAGSLGALTVHVSVIASTAGATTYEREVAARESAARREAAALLGALRLPAGSVPSAAEPGGDGGYLARAVFDSGRARSNAVDEAGWWIIPGTPAQALAYIHEHLPSGAGWWNGRYPPQTVPRHQMAILKGPDLGGVLSDRLLTLKVARLPGAQTGLRADGQVLWLVPAVKVPQGARLLRITARLVGPFHRIVRTVILRSASEIGRITRLVNAGREARPSFLPAHCPAAFGSVLLTFYRPARLPPLARATVAAGGCARVTVEIPGRLPVPRETPAQLLRRLEPILGLAFP